MHKYPQVLEQRCGRNKMCEDECEFPLRAVHVFYSTRQLHRRNWVDTVHQKIRYADQ